MGLQFTNIAERFMYIIITRFDGNKRRFSQSIGYAPQVISNIVVGKRKSKPSFDLLQSVLLTNKDINAHWLLTGKGEILQENVNVNLKKTTNYKERYIKLLEENRRLLSDSMFFQKKIFSAETEHLDIDYHTVAESDDFDSYTDNKKTK